MSHIALHCDLCGAAGSAALHDLECKGCGGPLDVVYRESLSGGAKRPEAMERHPGIWKWSGRLPLHESSDIISLGEGSTPCLRLERLGARIGLENLYTKVEYASPTGSFKDRGTSVMVSVVKELGFSVVVDDSSGNAGASLAAYAAAGGLRAVVFVPAMASPYKMAQIKFYGAELRPISGTREVVTEAARAYVEEMGACYASHNRSPYFIEGMKTFAYEAAQQIPAPIDHVVVPVGNGSLFLGGLKGFAELVEDGKLAQVPRFHCIQARACMPIVAASRGDDWDPDEARETVAGGIAVSVPPRGRQVVEAVKRTGGGGVAVEEESILEWHRYLAQDEGLFIEPTSAAAFASLPVLIREGHIASQDVTLVPLTGFGLKDRVPGS